MSIEQYLNKSNLMPAAIVDHGYRNCWIRDMWYVGICTGGHVKHKLWTGMIDILDRYKWKLEIHSKNEPMYWYEHLHIRYSPTGDEIGHEHWLHNQFDSHANFLEVGLDHQRLDLASLLVDYLDIVGFSHKPAAGAWEDRNSCDAYSLAACLHALQRAKIDLPEKADQIERMVKQGCDRLYTEILPYATDNKLVCLSLLGVIWPFNMAGPYRDEIIGLVKKNLMRKPFGFIRYKNDRYDGEHFSRPDGLETPWLLGDCWMAKVQPENHIWIDRIKRAREHFGFMPEAYFPETLFANRNSPLLWAEAMAADVL